jgi:hypothetical protein
VKGVVYVIQMEGHPWLKIGYSNGVDTRQRVRDLQVGCPLPLLLLKEYPCAHPHSMEQNIHAILAMSRRRGEWFETTLDAIDVAFILAQRHMHDLTYRMNSFQRAQHVSASKALRKAGDPSYEKVFSMYWCAHPSNPCSTPSQCERGCMRKGVAPTHVRKSAIPSSLWCRTVNAVIGWWQSNYKRTKFVAR